MFRPSLTAPAKRIPTTRNDGPSRNLAKGLLRIVLFCLVLHWAWSWVSERKKASKTSLFWKAEVDEDQANQLFLEGFLRDRQTAQRTVLDEAKRGSWKKNDRTPGGTTPVVVYWPNPQDQWFWIKYYGKGEGEHIEIKGCPVACELVSGSTDDAEQDNAHVLLQYNIFRGTLKRLKGYGQQDGLLPYQKASMFSMEPNTFLKNHQSRLALFDILASTSHLSDIRLETYTRRLQWGKELIGIADIDSSELANEIWGPNRALSPSRGLLQDITVPPALLSARLRLATFISNCNGGSSRNKLIMALVDEGIEFDHYGKCNETFFGGEPSPYSLDFAAQIPGSRQMSKMAILSLYRFNLVLENTIASDYITEKFFEGMLAGGIPIVLGAPNLAKKVQPPGSQPVFVDALRYTPKELATVIRQLSMDDAAYAKYRSWIGDLPKTSPLVEYAKHTQLYDYARSGSFMEHPICEMCKFYHHYYDWEEKAPLKFY